MSLDASLLVVEETEDLGAGQHLLFCHFLLFENFLSAYNVF